MVFAKGGLQMKSISTESIMPKLQGVVCAGFVFAMSLGAVSPAFAGRQVHGGDVARIFTGKAFRIECSTARRAGGRSASTALPTCPTGARPISAPASDRPGNVTKALARFVGSVPSHDHPIELQNLLFEAKQLIAERSKTRAGNLRHSFVARVGATTWSSSDTPLRGETSRRAGCLNRACPVR